MELYGTLKVSCLFFEDLSKHLKEIGFVLNPCVINMEVEGSWHGDDIKISHKNLDIVTGIINHISSIVRNRRATVMVDHDQWPANTHNSERYYYRVFDYHYGP